MWGHIRHVCCVTIANACLQQELVTIRRTLLLAFLQHPQKFNSIWNGCCCTIIVCFPIFEVSCFLVTIYFIVTEYSTIITVPFVSTNLFVVVVITTILIISLSQCTTFFGSQCLSIDTFLVISIHFLAAPPSTTMACPIECHQSYFIVIHFFFCFSVNDCILCI